MIAIYSDGGGEYSPDDYRPTGVYEDGVWLADVHGWEAYYPEGTPEEVLGEQLDGPSHVAVEVTEGSDELLERVEKAHSATVSPGETDFEVVEEGEDEKSSIGPPQATLLGVGDDVETVEDEEEP